MSQNLAIVQRLSVVSECKSHLREKYEVFRKVRGKKGVFPLAHL